VFLREEEKEGNFPIVPAHATSATSANSRILDPERSSRQSPARRSLLLFPQEWPMICCSSKKEVHERGQPL